MTEIRERPIEIQRVVERDSNGGLIAAAIFAMVAILGIVAYVAMSNDTRRADAAETAADRVGAIPDDVRANTALPAPSVSPPIQINVPSPAAAPAPPAAEAPAAPTSSPSDAADAPPAN